MAVANSPPYVPNLPQVNPQSDDVRALLNFVMQELRNIADAFNDISRLQLNPISAPPPTPRDGLICLADGTNWSPLGPLEGEGTKEHLVVYIQGAWQQASFAPGTYMSSNGLFYLQSQVSQRPFISMVNAFNDTNGPGLGFNKARGTLAAPLPVQVNDNIMQIYYAGWQNGGWRSGGYMVGQVDAAPAGNIVPSRLVFSTTSVGGSGNDNLMNFNSAGDLSVNGAMYCGTAGRISVYLSTTQSYASGSVVKIPFDQKPIDPNNSFDNTTNFRYTPPRAGTILVMAEALFQSAANDLNGIGIAIYKNGSLYAWGDTIDFTGTPGMDSYAGGVNQLVPLNTTDYMEIWVYGNTTGGGNFTINGSSARTYLTAMHMPA